MAMTYLERYLSGEHEQVWADLVALGPDIYEGPVYEDALAVAHETMRRVRTNLEILIPRLVAIGYQFGYGWAQPPTHQPFGWRMRRAYLRLLEDARYLPPILTVHSDVEDHLAEKREQLEWLRGLDAPAIILETQERLMAELEAQRRVATALRELEDCVGVLPLSVRAWYEVVGGVNLVGVHPAWLPLIAEAGEVDAAYKMDADHWAQGFDYNDPGGHPMQFLEPLVVFPLGGPESPGFTVLNPAVPRATAGESGGRESGAFGILLVFRAADGTNSLHIMQNGHGAYLERGQDNYRYEIKVPCACADALLLGEPDETTFVNYLRISFRWAGFPGWERMPVRPERDLAVLTEGLLPF
jgi:hypothetical protein